MRSPWTHIGGAALLVTALALGAARTKAEEANLEGAAAWQKLVGNTAVVTTKGGSYTEFYDADGSLRRVDSDGSTKGQWTIEGDKVCFDYPDDDDRVCQQVTVQGASGRLTDPDGTVDSFEILPGNAKAL